jgi:hypothetical protein
MRELNAKLRYETGRGDVPSNGVADANSDACHHHTLRYELAAQIESNVWRFSGKIAGMSPTLSLRSAIKSDVAERLTIGPESMLHDPHRVAIR